MYLVSCQEGKGEESVVKVWDYLNQYVVCQWKTVCKRIEQVVFAPSSSQVGCVGLDKRNHQVISLYQLQWKHKVKAELVAKQTSDFHIEKLQFASEKSVVTCGRENIRFWRVKVEHLVGSAVVLNNHARNNHFLCESVAGDKVYVGSSQGMLYIVDISTKQLENVFKLHDQALTSVKVSQGFCATGSKDCYLRVWPLDFSEFFLEARHEQLVSNIDIKQDGLKVLCGNDSNGLGVVDLQNQSYRTVLRSH